MAKNEYLERARREVEKAAAREGEYSGPCENCAFYNGGGFFTAKIFSECEHPAVALAAFNLPDRSYARKLVYCQEQRSARSVYGPVLCGPDGALFKIGDRTVAL